MTDIREELMRAASQAFDVQVETGGSFEGAWNASFDAVLPIIERRIAAARKEERERCAKICEGYGLEICKPGETGQARLSRSGELFAAAIRALGDK